MANSLATVIANLETIRDNLISELKTETTYRAANGPKPTYSVGGQSMDWNGYLSMMNKEIRAVTQQIADMSWGDGPVDSYRSA